MQIRGLSLGRRLDRATGRGVAGSFGSERSVRGSLPRVSGL